MRTSRSMTPRLEGMEMRKLLSGVGGAASAVVASAVVNQPVHLNGTIKGTYHEHQSNPDLPQVFRVVGHGSLGLGGQSNLSGTITAGGFTTHPDPRGDVVLTGARGTIRLHLATDTTANSSDALTDHFVYTVTGGSGKYRGATGQGTVVVTLAPASSARANLHSGHGRFTAVFAG